METNDLNFWKWLFFGYGKDKSGLKAHLWNKWLVVHVIVGIFLACLVPSLSDKASNVSIPFVSVLIALTVAWCGNVTTLLSTDEITELSKHYKGGMEGYAFSVQTTILILFISIILWVLSGFDFFEWFFGRMIVFSVSSLAVQECWNMILFVQVLTIARSKIALKRKGKSENKDEQD